MNSFLLNNYLDVCNNFVYTNENKEEILKNGNVLYKNDVEMAKKIIISLLELQELHSNITFYKSEFKKTTFYEPTQINEMSAFLIQRIREIISLLININNVSAGVYQHISVFIRNKEILARLLTLFVFLDKPEHSFLFFSSLFSGTKNIISDSVASILMRTGNSLFINEKFTLAKIYW